MPKSIDIGLAASFVWLVYLQYRSGVTEHALRREYPKYKHWSYSPLQGWYLTDRSGGEPKATVTFWGDVICNDEQ